MKQSLVLLSQRTDQTKALYRELQSLEINMLQFEDVCYITAGLRTLSPAFVLLDFTINGAKSLLYEIASSRCGIPRPYIMVAASYAGGSIRAEMLRQGADICVDWPINVEEVLAVVQAVRRRDRQMSVIVHEELSIDPVGRIVIMRGRQIVLTRKEYDVLFLLASHAGMVLTKEEIYCAVWKSNYDPKSTNVTDQISSLRFKLGLNSKDTTYIQTIIGIGYRFGIAA